MQATIKQVGDKPREWGAKFPGTASVQGMFEDGTQFEYVTKLDKAQPHIDALKALIGQPHEFQIDTEKTSEYQGVTRYKVVGYPGLQKGGGGKNWQPAYTQTEAGFRAEQQMMMRRTALMQAVEAAKDCVWEPDAVIRYADQFYEWLTDAQKPILGTQEPRTAAPVVQQGNGVWQGPGLCPTCHAPEGKRHGKVCLEAG